MGQTRSIIIGLALVLGQTAGAAAADWLRFDVTSELRNRATFHGLDAYAGPGFSGTDQYTSTLKSWVSLANVYWDIGCWHGITPYVGGGIGFAKNWSGDFTDINVPNLGVAFAKTTDEGNFAWAIHAGL
jgi:opacity protein-like surface antigen